MTAQKDLLVVVSETSGAQHAVKPELESVLKGSKLSYRVKQLKTPPEFKQYIEAQAGYYKAVAVYGGDGTVIAALKALADTGVKLLILPGGTANIVSAELGLAGSATGLLKMYIAEAYRTEGYDIAAVNKAMFVLDMHSGLWTSAITNAPRSLKKKFGAVAYGITAAKQLPRAQKYRYELEVDGKRKSFQAYTTLFANRGHQNFLGFPLFHKKHRAGIIQVAAIKSLNPVLLITWMLGRIIGKNNLGGAVRVYRARKVVVLKSPTKFIFDDQEYKAKLPITLTGAQHETRVIIPRQLKTRGLLSKVALSSGIMYVRIKERLRSFITGEPRYNVTQLAPHLYVGGTYRSHAYKKFKQWGVTGIVNMRSSAPRKVPDGFTVLHLKTRDWSPPSIESLTKGVEFIQARIKKGEGVYVHCRQGEGRGPTMAAAYLISRGMSVEEAISQIKKSRPMAHPNKSQVRRLSEWAELQH